MKNEQWKDHHTAKLVNDLRRAAQQYGKCDQLREQIASIVRPLCDRVQALEDQMAAIGAGGVEPLRKATPDKSDGWHLVSKSTQKRLAAKWGFVPASELDAEREDAECFRFWVSEAARAPGAMARLIMHCTTEQEYRDAILPIARKAREAMQAALQRIPAPDYDPQDVAFTARVELPPPLAPDHKGMRMNYKGLLLQVENALEWGGCEPIKADFVRQLCNHLKELGKRYYAGDLTVVDEFLQLYCIEKEARARLVAEREE